MLILISKCIGFFNGFALLMIFEVFYTNPFFLLSSLAPCLEFFLSLLIFPFLETVIMCWSLGLLFNAYLSFVVTIQELEISDQRKSVPYLPMLF